MTEILYSPFIYYMSTVRSLRHTVPSAPSWTTVIQFSIAWGLTALACLSSTPHHEVSKTGKLKLSQYSLRQLTGSHAKLLQRHSSINTSSIFMVALCNRTDHYIFALWFLLLLSFFPRLISAAADWMSTILPHMMWS